MNYRYRPEIDGLRAIAVIAVVFYHANFIITFNNIEYNFFSGGYLGVDVFYVISGYLITQLILNDLKKKILVFQIFMKKSKTVITSTFCCYYNLNINWLYLNASFTI